MYFSLRSLVFVFFSFCFFDFTLRCEMNMRRLSQFSLRLNILSRGEELRQRKRRRKESIGERDRRDFGENFMRRGGWCLCLL